MFSFQGTLVTCYKVTFEKLLRSFSKLTLVEMRRVRSLLRKSHLLNDRILRIQYPFRTTHSKISPPDCFS